MTTFLTGERTRGAGLAQTAIIGSTFWQIADFIRESITDAIRH
jgi:hypothetical protein